jgi:hypothetical protein
MSLDGNIDNLAKIVPGVQKKFDLQNFKEITLSDSNKQIFLSSVFTPSTCACDNVLLEAHYTVYYSDMGSTFSTSFKIDNITVDVVYG